MAFTTSIGKRPSPLIRDIQTPLDLKDCDLEIIQILSKTDTHDGSYVYVDGDGVISKYSKPIDDELLSLIHSSDFSN
ncbi:hypothetical protein ENUP19_0265G0044 [Entamoeba nuttalli]|uniref:Uncharacterized protein n=1 Tax=Entamoeba nuttalli TaxID=412467 RepID=A0ABQ0DSR0_9EUKA